mgnify:CR=1 FL=1
MTTVLTTFLCLILFVAGLDVAWSIRNLPQPKPVEASAVSPQAPAAEPPIQFDEAYRRYVNKVMHEKYADRLPLEAERVERHLKIIKEQLEAQQRIIEEARRP